MTKVFSYLPDFFSHFQSTFYSCKQQNSGRFSKYVLRFTAVWENCVSNLMSVTKKTDMLRPRLINWVRDRYYLNHEQNFIERSQKSFNV